MNKVAIVTGGARGIGKAIVEQIADMGVNVVLNYYNSEEQAIKTKSELEDRGKNIKIYKADISNRDEVRNLVEYTINSFGNIDILINNAGISQFKLFTEITDEDWGNMIKINLNSAFYMTQEVTKNMLHNKNGCIVNISSINGITGSACEVHYSACKAAMDGMTKALAKELAPSGIRVNSVAPGAIWTDMNKNLSAQTIKVIESEIPMGKIGKPEDVAKCVRWLIEDEYTTGQIISPNGGWVI